VSIEDKPKAIEIQLPGKYIVTTNTGDKLELINPPDDTDVLELTSTIATNKVSIARRMMDDSDELTCIIGWITTLTCNIK
jgi:hypothetical protein